MWTRDQQVLIENLCEYKSGMDYQNRDMECDEIPCLRSRLVEGSKIREFQNHMHFLQQKLWQEIDIHS